MVSTATVQWAVTCQAVLALTVSPTVQSAHQPVVIAVKQDTTSKATPVCHAPIIVFPARLPHTATSVKMDFHL